MKRTLTILILIFNCFVHAQSDSLPDLLIRYSNNKSIALSAFKKPHHDSISINTIEFKNALDTLIEYYTLQFECFPDSTYFNSIKNHIELDSVKFSELLIKSKLKMHIVEYGYGGAQNYEQLTEKYGVKYYAGGCIYNPSEIEKLYSRYMHSLLNIRNGSNWEEKYKNEASKIN